MTDKIVSRTKHDQIKKALKKELLSGRYTRGSQFYSQNELARHFKVSPLTARVAMAALVQEGLLTRSQGKGTFVTDLSAVASSKNLGLVIHHSEFFSLSYFAELARGVNVALDATEFHSLLLPFKEEQSRKRRGKFLLELAEKKKLDGLLIAASQVGTDELSRLQKARIPFVLVNCFWPGTDFDFVCPDFGRGSEIAVRHLVDNGYEPIVYFGGYGGKFPIEKERLEGYRKALRELRIPWRQEYEILLPLEDWDKACLKTKELDGVIRRCKDGRRVGILCGTDLMAHDLCQHFSRSGLRVPGDVAIIGAGDLRFSGKMEPPLTTVAYHEMEAGKLGAELLLKKIHGEKGTARRFVEPELIVRRTCLPSAAALKNKEPMRCGT